MRSLFFTMSVLSASLMLAPFESASAQFTDPFAQKGGVGKNYDSYQKNKQAANRLRKQQRKSTIVQKYRRKNEEILNESKGLFGICRTWSIGNHRSRGLLAEYRNGKVTLLSTTRADYFSYRLSEFSKEDQKYVEAFKVFSRMSKAEKQEFFEERASKRRGVSSSSGVSGSASRFSHLPGVLFPSDPMKRGTSQEPSEAVEQDAEVAKAIATAFVRMVDGRSAIVPGYHNQQDVADILGEEQIVLQKTPRGLVKIAKWQCPVLGSDKKLALEIQFQNDVVLNITSTNWELAEDDETVKQALELASEQK